MFVSLSAISIGKGLQIAIKDKLYSLSPDLVISTYENNSRGIASEKIKVSEIKKKLKNISGIKEKTDKAAQEVLRKIGIDEITEIKKADFIKHSATLLISLNDDTIRGLLPPHSNANIFSGVEDTIFEIACSWQARIDLHQNSLPNSPFNKFTALVATIFIL